MCYAVTTPSMDDILTDYFGGKDLLEISRSRALTLSQLIKIIESPPCQEASADLRRIQLQRAEVLAVRLLPKQIADLHEAATNDAGAGHRLRAQAILARITLQLTRPQPKKPAKTEQNAAQNSPAAANPKTPAPAASSNTQAPIEPPSSETFPSTDEPPFDRYSFPANPNPAAAHSTPDPPHSAQSEPNATTPVTC